MPDFTDRILFLDLLSLPAIPVAGRKVPELNKYWANFCNTDLVFEDGMDPAEWVKAATDAANAP